MNSCNPKFPLVSKETSNTVAPQYCIDPSHGQYESSLRRAAMEPMHVGKAGYYDLLSPQTSSLGHAAPQRVKSPSLWLQRHEDAAMPTTGSSGYCFTTTQGRQHQPPIVLTHNHNLLESVFTLEPTHGQENRLPVTNDVLPFHVTTTLPRNLKPPPLITLVDATCLDNDSKTIQPLVSHDTNDAFTRQLETFQAPHEEALPTLLVNGCVPRSPKTALGGKKPFLHNRSSSEHVLEHSPCQAKQAGCLSYGQPLKVSNSQETLPEQPKGLSSKPNGLLQAQRRVRRLTLVGVSSSSENKNGTKKGSGHAKTAKRVSPPHKTSERRSNQEESDTLEHVPTSNLDPHQQQLACSSNAKLTSTTSGPLENPYRKSYDRPSGRRKRAHEQATSSPTSLTLDLGKYEAAYRNFCDTYLGLESPSDDDLDVAWSKDSVARRLREWLLSSQRSTNHVMEPRLTRARYRRKLQELATQDFPVNIARVKGHVGTENDGGGVSHTSRTTCQSVSEVAEVSVAISPCKEKASARPLPVLSAVSIGPPFVPLNQRKKQQRAKKASNALLSDTENSILERVSKRSRTQHTTADIAGSLADSDEESQTPPSCDDETDANDIFFCSSFLVEKTPDPLEQLLRYLETHLFMKAILESTPIPKKRKILEGSDRPAVQETNRMTYQKPHALDWAKLGPIFQWNVPPRMSQQDVVEKLQETPLPPYVITLPVPRVSGFTTPGRKLPATSIGQQCEVLGPTQTPSTTTDRHYPASSTATENVTATRAEYPGPSIVDHSRTIPPCTTHIPGMAHNVCCPPFVNTREGWSCTSASVSLSRPAVFRDHSVFLRKIPRSILGGSYRAMFSPFPLPLPRHPLIEASLMSWATPWQTSGGGVAKSCPVVVESRAAPVNDSSQTMQHFISPKMSPQRVPPAPLSHVMTLSETPQCAPRECRRAAGQHIAHESSDDTGRVRPTEDAGSELPPCGAQHVPNASRVTQMRCYRSLASTCEPPLKTDDALNPTGHLAQGQTSGHNDVQVAEAMQPLATTAVEHQDAASVALQQPQGLQHCTPFLVPGRCNTPPQSSFPFVNTQKDSGSRRAASLSAKHAPSGDVAENASPHTCRRTPCCSSQCIPAHTGLVCTSDPPFHCRPLYHPDTLCSRSSPLPSFSSLSSSSARAATPSLSDVNPELHHHHARSNTLLTSFVTPANRLCYTATSLGTGAVCPSQPKED